MLGACPCYLHRQKHPISITGILFKKISYEIEVGHAEVFHIKICCKSQMSLSVHHFILSWYPIDPHTSIQEHLSSRWEALNSSFNSLRDISVSPMERDLTNSYLVDCGPRGRILMCMV